MFNIENYVNNINSIEGWCDPLTAQVIYNLGMFQDHNGNVMEIGVHHGKSFIPMAATVKQDEVAVALDIFEDQHLNYDKSGSGDKNIFLKNVYEWIDNSKTILPVQKDSTKIDPQSLVINDKSYRSISIDGSHTRETTKIDMYTADFLLDKKDGIVFIDDILNSHWLGVISGYVDFMINNSVFKPIAYIPNKLILSRNDSYIKYKQFLRSKFASNLSKADVPLFDDYIDIYK